DERAPRPLSRGPGSRFSIARERIAERRRGAAKCRRKTEENATPDGDGEQQRQHPAVERYRARNRQEARPETADRAQNHPCPNRTEGGAGEGENDTFRQQLPREPPAAG